MNTHTPRCSRGSTIYITRIRRKAPKIYRWARSKRAVGPIICKGVRSKRAVGAKKLCVALAAHCLLLARLYVALCCSVLQCVAVCCSVLQCVACEAV